MSFKISVLGKNGSVNQLIGSFCQEINLEIGYIGDSNYDLMQFFRSGYGFHLLFLSPSLKHANVVKNLEKDDGLNVNTIVIGAALPAENIPFLVSTGVSGYLSVFDLSTEIIDCAVKSIASQGYLINRHINKEWWEKRTEKEHVYPRNAPKFSESEKEVATYLCNGYSIAQIAVFRNKTESSIRFHIKNLMEKSYTYSIREFIITSIANLWVKIDMTKRKKMEVYS